MNENFSSNTTRNDQFATNSEETDYKNLINILKEISAIIALLEKTI